jgi:biopolymer transport protein ExbD
MEIGSSGSLKADINVTPLVDVMLVLLVVFMVTAPLLTAGGQMFVGKQAVDKGSLESTLRAKLRANPALQLQIRADRNARFRDIREVIRVGRDTGYANAALIADEIKDKDQAARAAAGGAGAPRGE